MIFILLECLEVYPMIMVCCNPLCIDNPSRTGEVMGDVADVPWFGMTQEALTHII